MYCTCIINLNRGNVRQHVAKHLPLSLSLSQISEQAQFYPVEGSSLYPLAAASMQPCHVFLQNWAQGHPILSHLSERSCIIYAVFVFFFIINVRCNNILRSYSKQGRINQTNSVVHNHKPSYKPQAVNFRSQGFFWTVPMAIALDVATEVHRLVRKTGWRKRVACLCHLHSTRHTSKAQGQQLGTQEERSLKSDRTGGRCASIRM